ncbi:hypothetical protein LNV08_11735 [Paucibacter sp. TC2R-5]|uniref:hypothetical protein n=1 Tax=Paucibacter sp. TC2R-5 TaxID=2893555 RepID=UPI0021E3A51A|nr:hypothetical protein [Paucibacter sp. TC2R-5]MCV2359640.1 hypothetical protein [Paucibacter sp. TC2R-5]
MKFDFNCRSQSGNPLMPGLVFSWNPLTGEVSGPDADEVRKMATWGSVPAHPTPWAWTLGPDPLKSYTDMAAVVGSYWNLPPELVQYYPVWEEDESIPEFTYVDADGVGHIGRDQLIY